ncbi:circularly permuted type 2 ATP-grasp protein [Aureibacillus halotolerans]|uniref:Putative circularly permuted ATP-grasp superfamily protein n=1 Tax=Aureibacillus halotolerans TaxID=1508390 RepID=A0A4R6TVB2_9BACI|nr:circularly permuted type 2 ATP-grasp protein [Aureibacillus halotolerans]TDQ37718.1 putative circularly permuted ATP-grasp superfamily protein [Aureibacillus halotolerans]
MVAINSSVSSTYYEEMFQKDGSPRLHYERWYNVLLNSNQDHIRKKQEAARQHFLNHGITFTVYQDDLGTERTMPFDFIPFILPPQEWRLIHAGVKQRVRALNHFLEDIYKQQNIVKDGIVPGAFLAPYIKTFSAIRDIDIPLNNHIFLAGIDVIRDDSGEYYVLEDNLRNPSGLSYVYQNRAVTKKVYGEFLRQQPVKDLEMHLHLLRESLYAHAPKHASNDPCAVLLTPGAYNSAYYDHVFIAQQLGIDLVENQDLLCRDDKVYMKTIFGLQRVDIIYRRIDDDYLDPTVFRKESLLGVPGVIEAYKKGNVSILNPIGNGAADDKALYAYVPEMIRYYLNEEPLLKNVPTFLLSDEEQKEMVLQRLDRYVVKNVAASGGYDMLIGPHAEESQLNAFREKIQQFPEQYIAQPTMSLSRLHAYQNDRFYPCHVDLRIFAFAGNDINIIPGGLSRVALREGSLIVNSSQGGGGKDTWVIHE